MSKMTTSERLADYLDIVDKACKIHLKLVQQPSTDQLQEFFNWGFVFIVQEKPCPR